MLRHVFPSEVIAEDLRQGIFAGQFPAGLRLPPEPLLARQYGVNRLTLRKALARLAEEGLLSRRPRHGTVVLPRPAATLPAGAAPAATLVVVGQREGHFYGTLAQALQRAAQQVGRSVFHYDPAADGAQGAARKILHRLVQDGHPVLVMPDAWARVAELALAQVRPPLLLGHIWQALPAGTGTVVLADDMRGGQLATEHLLQLGHRRLAFIGTHPELHAGAATGPVTVANAAYCGFVQAQAVAGVPVGPSLGYYAEGPGVEAERRIGAFLDALPARPTAIVCDADFRVVSLYAALAARGLRVPADVSVVGYGDTPWCTLQTPAITSVSYAIAAVAHTAVALAALPAMAARQVVQVTPHLLLRASTAPPAGGRAAVRRSARSQFAIT